MPKQNRYQLARFKTVYTQFAATLEKITTAEPSNIEGFIGHLQEKLDEKLEDGNSPDAPILLEIPGSEDI